MPSSILETGLALARAGLAVHWLWPRSKVPLHEEYQLRPWTCAEELYADWESRRCRGEPNLGLHTGSVAGARYCVVAADLDSVESLAWADANLPPTPIRNQSHKGEHRLYRHPQGVVVRNRAKIRVNGVKFDLDLRGDGGHLVIAPSIHPSGTRYVAPSPWTEEALAAMPTWNPRWIPAEPERPLAPSRTLATDERSLMERGRKLTVKWQLCDRGHGQGTETFKLAGYLLHQIGMSEQATFEVMWNHYNPRCAQPYNESLLRRKVQEAAGKIRRGGLSDV